MIRARTYTNPRPIQEQVQELRQAAANARSKDDEKAAHELEGGAVSVEDGGGYICINPDVVKYLPRYWGEK